MAKFFQQSNLCNQLHNKILLLCLLVLRFFLFFSPLPLPLFIGVFLHNDHSRERPPGSAAYDKNDGAVKTIISINRRFVSSRLQVRRPRRREPPRSAALAWAGIRRRSR